MAQRFGAGGAGGGAGVSDLRAQSGVPRRGGSAVVGRGTFQYKAPELFDENDPKYDKPAGVYSFAMLLWESFSSFVPWTGPTAADKKNNVQITSIHVLARTTGIDNPRRPPLPPSDTCPPRIVDLETM